MFSLPLGRSSSSSKPISTRPPARSRRIIFSIVRLSIYAAVFVFGLICLGMAGSFQHVLAASDLTRFVPFALFVCSASLLCISVLILFGLMKERNPISTRGELLSFSMVGLLWFVLGIYLTTSESQSADVECFSSPDATTPLSDSIASFHTEQYQAMYRVLMVFALMNAVIIIIASSLMLLLAIRKHRNGDQHMWYGPITSCAWLQSYSKSAKNQRSNSQKSILPKTNASAAPVMVEKQLPTPSRRPTRERSHSRHNSSGRRPSTSNRVYGEHRRHGSGNAPYPNVDFENGAMVEPARAAYPSRERHRY